MRKSVGVVIVSALVLTSCGTVRESRLNPFNWFGRSTSQPVVAEQGDVNPLIPKRRASIFRAGPAAEYVGTPITQVTQLEVLRRPGGAIVQATGVASRIGPYEVRLIKDKDASTDSVLVYSFRVIYPAEATQQGSVAARTITVAASLTDQELSEIRTVRVAGQTNVLSARR